MAEEVANKLPTFLTEEETGVKSSGLSVQSLDSLDVSTLHPLSPEVISRQATVNIGTIGHVAHGKSTVVKAISGVQTVRYRNEIRRNITIKLGYANAKIYQCPNDVDCPPPSCFRAFGSNTPDEKPCPKCGAPLRLLRHVSFVDCPGHDILMATMLNGAAVMDAALLLVAANEPCPQPQTAEHLAAVDIMQLRNLIILQNKIDLVRHESGALDQYRDIRRFIKGTNAAGSPIVPISAQLSFNIDSLLEYMVNHIPVPERNFVCRPRMIVIRSFDVNKAGWEVDQLKGGVAGGSIVEGVLRKGQEIEIRPGIINRSEDGSSVCTPIRTTVLSLFAEENELQYAVPGGLIGVGTKVDPALTRQDRLVGQVIGDPGFLPDIFSEIEISYFLLRRLLGVKGDSHKGKVQRLQIGEVLMVNIGSMSTGGRILAVKDDQAKIVLTTPVCTQVDEKLALSRRVDKHWRLIGWGQIRRGVALSIPESS